MPFFGLLVYFFCLYIRPQDWIPGFLEQPVDYIVFSFILITGVFKTSIAEFKEVLAMWPTKIMILWTFIVFCSNFFHGDFEQSFEFLFKYLRFLFIFITFALHITSFRRMKWLFLFMILLTATLAIQGIYQKQNGIGWAGQPLGWLDRIVWIGLWDGMNVLCLLFVVSFPFLLQFLSNVWPFRYRLYAFIAIPIIMWGIYLTESRGGFMALLIVFFLHFRARFRSFLGMTFGIGVILGMIAFAPSRFGDFHDEDDSASYRVDMWAEAFEMVTYNPILGIGKGNFMAYTNKLIAHNSFLEVMGETGCAGLFSWLALLYVSLQGLIGARARAENAQERSIMEGLLICIISYLCTSCFVTAEFELLYVFLALALVATRLKNVEVHFKVNDFRNVALIQAFGMTAFFIVTRVYFKIYG